MGIDELFIIAGYKVNPTRITESIKKIECAGPRRFEYFTTLKDVEIKDDMTSRIKTLKKHEPELFNAEYGSLKKTETIDGDLCRKQFITFPTLTEEEAEIWFYKLIGRDDLAQNAFIRIDRQKYSKPQQVSPIQTNINNNDYKTILKQACASIDQVFSLENNGLAKIKDFINGSQNIEELNERVRLILASKMSDRIKAYSLVTILQTVNHDYLKAIIPNELYKREHIGLVRCLLEPELQNRLEQMNIDFLRRFKACGSVIYSTINFNCEHEVIFETYVKYPKPYFNQRFFTLKQYGPKFIYLEISEVGDYQYKIIFPMDMKLSEQQKVFWFYLLIENFPKALSIIAACYAIPNSKIEQQFPDLIKNINALNSYSTGLLDKILQLPLDEMTRQLKFILSSPINAEAKIFYLFRILTNCTEDQYNLLLETAHEALNQRHNVVLLFDLLNCPPPKGNITTIYAHLKEPYMGGKSVIECIIDFSRPNIVQFWTFLPVETHYYQKKVLAISKNANVNLNVNTVNRENSFFHQFTFPQDMSEQDKKFWFYMIVGKKALAEEANPEKYQAVSNIIYIHKNPISSNQDNIKKKNSKKRKRNETETSNTLEQVEQSADQDINLKANPTIVSTPSSPHSLTLSPSNNFKTPLQISDDFLCFIMTPALNVPHIVTPNQDVSTPINNAQSINNNSRTNTFGIFERSNTNDSADPTNQDLIHQQKKRTS